MHSSSGTTRVDQDDGLVRPKVVVIAGSTGVGKSDVAAMLCRWHDGIVVSADSVQAYEGVEIGANKPTADERRETPHLLVDVVSSRSPYNAADWRRDALRAIRGLLLMPTEGDRDAQNGTSEGYVNDATGSHSVESAIREARRAKGYPEDQPLLPVVVGGTMMYLQWLVHGIPDAAKPSAAAAERAATTMSDFEASEDWMGAVACLMQEADDPSQAAILKQQVDKLSGRDWYRLRRILEVAYTMKESKQQEGDANDVDPWERLYTGERSGGLMDLGCDVRCFFLCPSDRMDHTRVIDERCEDMIRRGLLKETADLAVAGHLPDMVTKAIGYRQALEYLSRNDATICDEPSFHGFLDAFTTATRRYARKQMLWFRKDPTFVFVPVDVVKPKSDRILEAATEIDRMIRMSRDDYDLERTSNEGVSEQTRRLTELQAKKMKTYQFQRYVLRAGSSELASSLTDADECTRRFQLNTPSDHP